MVVRQTTKPVHPIANVSITKFGLMPIDRWTSLLSAARTMPASTEGMTGAQQRFCWSSLARSFPASPDAIDDNEMVEINDHAASGTGNGRPTQIPAP